jgi:hypothetical protein
MNNRVRRALAIVALAVMAGPTAAQTDQGQLKFTASLLPNGENITLVTVTNGTQDIPINYGVPDLAYKVEITVNNWTQSLNTPRININANSADQNLMVSIGTYSPTPSAPNTILFNNWNGISAQHGDPTKFISFFEASTET